MSFPVMFGMILTVTPAARHGSPHPIDSVCASAQTRVAPTRARRINAKQANTLFHQARLARQLLCSLVVRRHTDPISGAPNVAALNKPPVRDRARNCLRGHPDILRAL